MLMAEIKDLLCLGQIQGSPIGMVTGTVADRNQQLGADIGCKVQDPDPLFTGQDTAVTVGHPSAGHSFKVVIGFCGPCAGYADPGRTQRFGKLPQPLVIQIDGGDNTPSVPA